MGVKDNYIYEECMKELRATFGEKKERERKNMRAKITEFFNTAYGLTMFTIKTLWILIRDDMKKESQTYKEEREQQKKRKKTKNYS